MGMVCIQGKRYAERCAERYAKALMHRIASESAVSNVGILTLQVSTMEP